MTEYVYGDPQDELDGFPGRLRTVIGQRSVRAFARDCGLSDAALRQYLSGQSEPTRPALIAMARTGGASVEWLATGRGPRQDKPRFELTPQVADPSTIDITPILLERRGAHEQADEPAGQAADASVYVLLSAEASAYVIQELDLRPEQLTIRFVRGDAMEPFLRDGDAALLDGAQVSVPADGIYGLVLRDNPVPLFRRLQRMPGGTVRATCENPAYVPFEFHPAEREEVSVLGRVVWVSHRL